MDDVSNRSRVDVDRVLADARAMLSLFAEVLSSIGYEEAARSLPLVGVPEHATRDDDAVLAATIGFHLISLVEEWAAEQYREDAERTGRVESGLWRSVAAQLAAQSSEAALRAGLARVDIEPVLTAHPTEARRISAIEQYRALHDDLGSGPALVDLDRRARARVAAALERIFRSGEVRIRKPSVEDERAVVIHVLAGGLREAVDEVDARLEDAWRALGHPTSNLPKPKVRFASWVGGDRDGHPFVTAEVTREALRDYRRAALSMHRQSLERLAARLGISALSQPPPPALKEAIERATERLGPRAAPALARNPEEPWRTFVNLVLARLPTEDEDLPGTYTHAEELTRDLQILSTSLRAIGAARLAEADILPVLRSVEVFGFHLVALDVRQNSAVHDLAIEQLLSVSRAPDRNFSAWSEEVRLAFLERELESIRPMVMRGTETGREAEMVTSALRVLDDEIRTHGSAGAGALVVSMTRSVSDLLVPFLLAREAGLLRSSEAGPLCPLPVVPLFETIEDLAHAPEILDAFLRTPIVRRSLEFQRASLGRERPVVLVMVGYSDSNKDGGLVASLWSLHRAEGRLLATARAHGVDVRFFHGRGGTLSRGAGPTHRFLSALPRGALSAGLRLTEQGETIFQKYGTHEAAVYNLELLAAGTWRRIVLDEREDPPPPEWPAAMDRVADAARRAYEGLVHHEGFLTFFRDATPIDVIETSGIGSRPTRRSGQRTLSDLRAIPWVFSWAQSGFQLTGWFGLGTGFEALKEESPELFEALCRVALEWPPLRYIVANASVSLLAVDPRVMRLYAGLVEDGGIREQVLATIERERILTRAVLEKIYGGPLEVARHRIHRLFELRREGLLAVHERQVALLRTWRSGGRSDESLRRSLLATVNAIAAGIRTTG